MKNGSLADKVVIGFLLILGMAETGHLLMVFGHRPFSDAVICFAAETVVLLAGGCGAWFWRRQKTATPVKKSTKRPTKRSTKKPGLTGRDITPLLAGIGLAFVILVLFQIMTISYGETVVIKGDQTLEAVQSLLEKEEIYTVNPLTGRAYTAGVPKRIQILGLPTLYGILCRIMGALAGDPLGGSSLCFALITRWIPVAVLCLTYLVYGTIAKILFPEKNDREKRMLFLTITAAVFCAGDYLFGMDGFGLLCCGYRAVAIRNCILVPYTFSLALRGRWKTALLCILAEACIVWTLYGMGTCAAVLVGMAAVTRWRKNDRGSLRAVGREE